jgi:aspartate aminotransferase
MDNEYLPVEGLITYLEASKKLAFGEDYYKAKGKQIAACHCLSGTGSVRLGFQFISRFLPGVQIYIPDPTWPNHLNIARDSGLPFKLYKYFNPKTKVKPKIFYF